MLDTWFSSALWPFSTLGWPDKTEDLAYWYPTDVLVTAYDIIFFWVARMIFSGCEHMGRKPFDKVFIHGLIRDAEGRKMSKSLGNGIDPMEEIDKYGADALRMTLVTGISPGNDSRYIPSRVEFSRNFANKLWNASRFVLMNAGDEAIPVPPADELEPEDKWILSSLNDLITEVGENVEKYEIGIAAGKVTDFVWDLYCDWYIEFTKPRLREGGRSAACARAVLVDVLKNVLKLLHPFMPFITEEIYGSIPGVDELLITSAWPEPDAGRCFPAEKAATEALMERVRAIRNRRAEMNVPPSRKAHLAVLTADRALYETNAAHLEKLASVSGLRFLESAGEVDESKMTVIICGSDRLYIPTGDLVDFAKELERLRGTLAKQSAELEKLETRLANENFTSRAPAALVESERARAASLRESVESTKAAMAAMEARI